MIASAGPRLDDRTVLVAGASAGIGRESARGFARAGARVIVAARRQRQLESLCEEIAAEGGAAEVAVCDLTDPSSVTSLFSRLERVDVVFANIGGNRPAPMDAVSEADLAWSWSVNVVAPYRLAQATARLQIKRGEGASIIFMSSEMGHVGSSNRTVYCTAKHAVEGMAKSMAIELAPHRIRVNAIAPTFVRTPMTESFLADEAFRSWVHERIPLGGPLEAGELLGALLLVASDAGSGITGTSLVIDGGWTAQ